jgi:hypothetical protein
VRNALEPGRTEIELWSLLAATNTDMGGEYMETRLPRLRRADQSVVPGVQRAARAPRELVSIDTDMVGPTAMTPISRAVFSAAGQADRGAAHDLRTRV